MRFHLAGLPHTVTSRDYCSCAYTMKTLNMAKMLVSLGHEVIHYGAEGSEVPCEHVTLISAEEQRTFFGERQRDRSFPVEFDAKRFYWQLFNGRAAREILARKQDRDFLLLIGGVCHKPIADQVGEGMMTVEYGIGYYGTFAPYQVFESYTHQAACYAMRSADPDARLFDAVIPNYYDLDDYPLPKERTWGNCLLYIGRLIHRKGVEVAVETAKRAGKTLILAGQGAAEVTDSELVTEDGMRIELSDRVQYVGCVGVEERARLMGNALAVLVPTLYMEPFGGVAVEAALVGTPVITTDHAAFSETVVHGITGYRCHTLEQFVWAAKNTGKLAASWHISHYARSKYSLARVGRMYEEYFRMLSTLWGEGWYAENAARKEMDWLQPMVEEPACL